MFASHLSVHPLSPLFYIPARLGDHHLGSNLVELIPQLLLVQRHFRVIVDVLLLSQRAPGRDPSEGEARKARKDSSVRNSACRSAETVGRTKGWKPGRKVGATSVGRKVEHSGESEVRSGSKVGHERSWECHICTAGRHDLLNTEHGETGALLCHCPIILSARCCHWEGLASSDREY